MLCPIDLGGKDESGKTIEGFSDRTISALLDDLSAAKGNNIVSTLTSCARRSTLMSLIEDTYPRLLSFGWHEQTRSGTAP